MRAFAAAFRLEWASLARSGAAWTLAAAALAWSLATPHLLKGDGTAQSAFMLDVRYTIGAVFALALATMAAAAAGTLAKDREAKRLQLTLARPANPALTALARMAAAALCGSIAIGIACIAVAARNAPFSNCDHAMRPILESTAESAKRLYDEYCEKHPGFKENAEKAGRAQTLRYLEGYVKTRLATVGPGKTGTWKFPEPPEGSGGLSIRCRFMDPFGRLEKTSGVFRRGGMEGRIEAMTRAEARVALATPAGPGSPAAGPGEVAFRNDGTSGATFSPRNDLKLLAEGGTLAANAAKAWLVLSATLSTAVAFCVFLGACLGRSVAVFCAIAMLAMSIAAPAAVEDSLDPLSSTRSELLALDLAMASEAVLSPLNAFHPVESLENRECVENGEVLRASLAGFLFHPLLFSALAGFAMMRKRD